MHTGYDSFWMYQNNRHEPVLDLPKNDNYGHAVITDSHKQMQNGEQPSQLNSYLPPQNNVQSSYLYNQYSSGGSQYMWHSSVYSMPLKPSYMSNFHPVHSNNVSHSSEYYQAQQKLIDYRYLKNVNASVPYCQQGNNTGNSHNNCVNAVPPMDNQNANKQTARIRVKDVFSLNNNATSKQVQNTSLYQTPQKQPECALNYGTINHSTTYNSKTQREYFNYGEGNPCQPNPPPLYYGAVVTGLPQQLPQNSNQFYPQNAENQLQFMTNRPRERNFSFESSQARMDQSIINNTLNVGNNQGSNVQNGSNSSNSVQESSGAKNTPRNLVEIDSSGMINKSGYADLLGVNKTSSPKNFGQNNTIQFQNRRAEVENTCLSKSKPPSAAAAAAAAAAAVVTAAASGSNGSTPVSAKSPGHQLNGRQDTTVKKISTPHSGQDTFLSLADCKSTNESSSLSLPCLLQSNEQLSSGWITQSKNNTKENSVLSISVPLTDEAGVTNASEPDVNPNPALSSPNPESEYQKTLTVPPRKRFFQVKDPLIGLNKENLEKFINSTPDNSSGKVSSKTIMEKFIAMETCFQKDITMNALTLKQENCNNRAESPAPEHNISEGTRVSLEIIKREKTPEDENLEYSTAEEDYSNHSREGSNILEGQFSSLLEISENIEFSKTDIRKFVLTSETPDASPKDLENRIQKAQDSKNNPGGNRNDSQAEKQVQETKVDPLRKNYKSKINRDKLTKLIQFLEKDDQSGKTNSVQKNRVENTQKGKKPGNRSRRKLSKTCVVRNKNNSREMISMMSHKSSRVEIKSPSPTPEIVKPGENSKKKEEITPNSSEDRSITDESCSSEEEHVKSNPVDDIHMKTEDPSKSEPNNPRTSEHIRETSREPSSERNCVPERVIQRIRALKNSKPTVCKKCNLISTLDLFWVNVVSEELKCLNCLKKMLEIEESESKPNDIRNSETKAAQNDNTGVNWASIHDWSNGSNLKDSNRLKGSTKSVINPINHQENIKHEVMESPSKSQTANSVNGEKKSAHDHSRKGIFGSTSVDQKKVRKEIPAEQALNKNNLKEESSHKTKHSEDWSKAEIKHEGKEGNNPKGIFSGENNKKDQPVDQSLRKIISKEHRATSKSENSIRKSSTSKEEEFADHNKREEKGTNHSNQMRKRSESRDSFHKGVEDLSKKEVKTASEKLNKNSRESHKDIAQQTAKKAMNHEHSEPKLHSHSKESISSQKPKTSEQVKPKESDSLEARRTSSSKNSEKPKRLESTCQSRKRKYSDEDLGASKVHVVEDHIKRDVKVMLHRTNVTSISTEDTAKLKNKIVDKETQNVKNSTDKSRRSSTKEEEQSKKETNDLSDTWKAKMTLKRYMIHRKLKTQEHAKQKADDMLVRKTKEVNGVHRRHEHSKSEVKQTVETVDLQRRKSTSKDDAESPRIYSQNPFKTETKHGGFTAENKDRKKTEEREKNHASVKTAKILSSEREEQTRKLETASRPLKENQNRKMGEGTKTEIGKSKTKDLHQQKRENKKEAEVVKSEKKHYKRIRETEAVVDVSPEKKKCSDNSVRKWQTENRHGRGLDEACSGEKKKGVAPKEKEDGVDLKQRRNSGSLLDKVLKKTKKLSWGLLEEA